MKARIEQFPNREVRIYIFDPHPDGGSLHYGPGARTARRYEPGEAVNNVLPVLTLPRHMADRALDALKTTLNEVLP